VHAEQQPRRLVLELAYARPRRLADVAAAAGLDERLGSRSSHPFGAGAEVEPTPAKRLASPAREAAGAQPRALVHHLRHGVTQRPARLVADPIVRVDLLAHPDVLAGVELAGFVVDLLG